LKNKYKEKCRGLSKKVIRYEEKIISDTTLRTKDNKTNEIKKNNNRRYNYR